MGQHAISPRQDRHHMPADMGPIKDDDARAGVVSLML